MPELPEAETVRTGLAKTILNSLIESVVVHDPRSLKRHPGGPDDFQRALVGNRIGAVVRRGKFLWLPLSSKGFALVAHLGMSGQILVRSKDFEPERQNRISINVADPDFQIRFVDQRIFGSMMIDELEPTSDLAPGGFSPETSGAHENLIPRSVAHISRDPLDPFFDRARVLSKLKLRNSSIKRALLDQGLVSGIGNIYADESLWRARLHFDQPASSISTRKLNELFDSVTEVLQAAVIQGGTSFDEQYKNVNGESGYFSQQLNAYGQAGTNCNRCGAIMKREAWANRGSHFCPHCQKIRKQKLK